MNFASSFFLGTSICRSVAERRLVRFLWILPVLILAGILSGCSILPGHDPLVVRAEQATQLLYVTTDRLLAWEHANRGQVPQLKPVCDRLRQNVPWVLERCRDATKAYKKAKTDLSRRTLVLSLASVETSLDEAQLAAVGVPSFNAPQPPPLP